MQDFILQIPMRAKEFFKILYFLFTATILRHQLNTPYVYIYICLLTIFIYSREHSPS